MHSHRMHGKVAEKNVAQITIQNQRENRYMNSPVRAAGTMSTLTKSPKH